jgi:hypothetical protein
MGLDSVYGGQPSFLGGGEGGHDGFFASDHESERFSEADQEEDNPITPVDHLEGAPDWLNAFEELWRTPEVAADEQLQKDLQASGEP